LHTGNAKIYFIEKYGCCDFKDDHENCCTNESHYLKDYSEYTTPETGLIKIPLLKASILNNQIKLICIGAIYGQYTGEIPTVLASCNILKHTGQLLL
jgi:hypothetical protein